MSTITNNKFTLCLNQKGYYELAIADGAEIYIADVEMIKMAQKALSGEKLPILVSGGQFSTTNIDTLKYISKNENMPFSKISAFVMNSIPQKIFGNFYLKFYKPERPTKFFNSKAEAIDWLSQYL